MIEIPIDPAAYQWHEREQDHEVPLDIPPVYKFRAVRPIRVGRHVVSRTYIVWSTHPQPRIPGVELTPIKETN